MMKKYLFCIILMAFFLSGCASKSGNIFLKNNERISFKDDMGLEELSFALGKSLEYYKRFEDEREFNFGKGKIKLSILKNSLEKFNAFIKGQPDSESLSRYINDNFDIYIPHEGEKIFLFTGYYEPSLRGSLVKTERFSYPLYSVPNNLVHVNLGEFSDDLKGRRLTGRLDGKKLVPYYTNEDIAFGDALDGSGSEIVWVDSQIDLFFLQIQGSGKIYLDDGRVLRVHYAGTNGHGYSSIGRYLINTGKMSKEGMSMQGIKEYLLNHPEDLKEVLSYNKSYVFFEKVEGGPYGALNVALTPGRSIAMDLKKYPKGALIYIKARKPLLSGDKIMRWKEMERFMLIQDTGGAIRGGFRGDIFFGSGQYAEIAAGHMAEKGEVFLFVPKNFDKE